MKNLTTDEAAQVAGCSASTVRKKLTPVEVVKRRVRGRGELVSYLYDRSDAELLKAGLPTPTRKHPDPATQAKLVARAADGTSTRQRGLEVADAAHSLLVALPLGTPVCCKRHARNAVRHDGSNYDELCAHLQAGRDSAGYISLRRTMDSKVDAALAGNMPVLDDCQVVSGT